MICEQIVSIDIRVFKTCVPKAGIITCPCSALQWRHNERGGVSNHKRLDYLLNRLFRRRSKKTSKLRVTGLCEGNPPVTGGFPSQWVSNTENVSIWWRYHESSYVALHITPTMYLLCTEPHHLTHLWHLSMYCPENTSLMMWSKNQLWIFLQVFSSLAHLPLGVVLIFKWRLTKCWAVHARGVMMRCLFCKTQYGSKPVNSYQGSPLLT